MNGGMNFNMKCPNCSSIFGATNADTCPECGTKLDGSQMDREKLNLLHITLDMDIGGLQRLVADATLAMDQKRFNIEVCCFDELGCFANTLKEEGITVTLLQKNQNHFDANYPFRLASFLRKKKVDILHMHTGTFFFGSIAARLARTPVSLYTEHGRFFVEPLVRLIEDRISGMLIGQIVAVSHELEKYLAERVKLPARKICTIINGIRVDRFAPRPKPLRLLEEFDLAQSCKIVGTVGRLDDVKDQVSMIEAFARVVEAVPDARLFLVGEGPMREALTEVISSHSLEKKVVITGARGDIPDLLNLFDLFVLTSVSEGTSISILEAMASGLPVVATNVGGNPSIIDHESDGLLVEPRDITGIANAIESLLTNNALSQQMGEKGAAKIRSDYSIEKMIESYEEIYFRLLRKKRKFKNLAN